MGIFSSEKYMHSLTLQISWDDVFIRYPTDLKQLSLVRGLLFFDRFHLLIPLKPLIASLLVSGLSLYSSLILDLHPINKGLHKANELLNKSISHVRYETQAISDVNI